MPAIEVRKARLEDKAQATPEDKALSYPPETKRITGNNKGKRKRR
jgi:hypothetical protein